MFWPTEYVFEIDADGWDRKVIDKGPYFLLPKDASGKRYRAYQFSGDKHASTAEFFLDGDGNPIKITDDMTADQRRETVSQAPVWTFKVCPVKDFSILGLGG